MRKYQKKVVYSDQEYSSNWITRTITYVKQTSSLRFLMFAFMPPNSHLQKSLSVFSKYPEISNCLSVCPSSVLGPFWTPTAVFSFPTNGIIFGTMTQLWYRLDISLPCAHDKNVWNIFDSHSFHSCGFRCMIAYSMFHFMENVVIITMAWNCGIIGCYTSFV